MIRAHNRHRILRSALFAAVSLALTAWSAAAEGSQEAAPVSAGVTEDDPEATPKGRDVYLGRDIARTMHWRGADWLLRETRENEENGELLRKWLELRPGTTVCDLGCGNGYHTLPLAQAVGPEGKVFAVDLQPKMLELLTERAEQMEINNLIPIECTVDDPRLPENSTDVILMVDVYHELSHPVRVLGHLRRALRKRGQVVLVEFRAEDRGVPIKVRHKMSKAQVIREMAANGFTLAKETDGLPWQHAMAFSVPEKLDAAHEARELGRGFLAAMAGEDARIVRPFLADFVVVGEGQPLPVKDLAISIGAAMDLAPPIPKLAKLSLTAGGGDSWIGAITGPPKMEVMEGRRTVRIEKGPEGRFFITEWR